MKGSAIRIRGGASQIRREAVDVPDPGPGEVRVRVMACGMCGNDIQTIDGADPDSVLTPGHEIAGVVDAIGPGVQGWRPGGRVGVGWFGGSCGECDFCRSGDVVHCAQRRTPGISYPGGWADMVIVPAAALFSIPDELSFTQAAPMGCAGVTTFNAVRWAHLPVGRRVAVLGVGGLGHLAVQFAAKMGYEVIAMARGADREGDVLSLGAHHFIDTGTEDPGEALRAAGGADLILNTAPSAAVGESLLAGLRVYGQITFIGSDPSAVSIPVSKLMGMGVKITGQLTGSPRDIEEAMRFALVTGIRPVTRVYALDDAADAIARLREGTVRYRNVLTDEPALAG
ncbi:alcohol dehydrogenase catalytic domain-containing protein [Spelaeicoccus albus]|uniref:alcohol dehydrogenase n=1 Tax=Spelaeicoccus albus TaxID=1280376 RepID=A0A7Z0A8A7_9MICO|nr:alcohol dehydrogenase catalytic domain-containing protein [Spelaeicoccus albus]NYI66197.1 alcohol dehydrogenase [Spelaeicoccus albus]